MSREIKFRAWDTKNKKWLTAVPSLEYLLDDEDGCVSHHDYDAEDAVYFYPHNPLGNDFEGRIIYQQFTGLLDKNGREIWEGDICDAGMVIGTVDYLIGGFSLASNQLIEYLPTDTEDYNTLDVKVIGNVLENPDFFK